VNTLGDDQFVPNNFDECKATCHTYIELNPEVGLVAKAPKRLLHKAMTAAARTHVLPTVTSAVLGTGSIGVRHLRVLRDLLGAHVSAIPMRTGRRAVLRDEGFEVCDSLEAAVEAGTGAVVIATDTSRHVTDLRAAVQLGCSALVEKPLAPTARGLGELASFLERSKKNVFVACDLRFDQSLLYFRQRLDQVGTVHAVRIECQSYLPDWRPDRDYRQSYSARAGEGGVLLDLIHEIDYAVWLFGAPSRVFARLSNSGRLGIEAEEAADCFWETSTGALVSIRLDYVTRKTHRTMRAYGANGEIEWDGVEQSVTVRVNGTVESRDFPQNRDATIQDQDAAFLRAASGGDPATLTQFSEGALAVSICDAARRSSGSGQHEAVLDWRQA
jgi:predicted dehydrogenase